MQLVIFYAYMSILTLSWLAGLTVYFRSGQALYLKLFPVFLFIISMVEWLAVYISGKGISNTRLYNISFIFEYCFYLFILHEVIFSRRVKRIILAIGIFFVLCAMVNLSLIQKFDNFNTYTVVLGSFFIVSIGMYYFIELFQRPKATNLVTEPAFWICSGLIFYNFCTLPYFGLINYLSSLPRSISFKLYYALQILNLFLYSLFIIAFLCRIRIRKSL